MAVIKLFFCVAVFGASVMVVQAISKVDIAAWTQQLLPHIAECSQTYSIPEGILKEAQETINPEGIDSCFFACMGKKLEIIKDGKFDNVMALEKAKEYLKDPEDIKNAEEAINDCSSVNSEGGDECAVAKSLVQCLMKHKGKFNLA